MANLWQEEGIPPTHLATERGGWRGLQIKLPDRSCPVYALAMRRDDRFRATHWHRGQALRRPVSVTPGTASRVAFPSARSPTRPPRPWHHRPRAPQTSPDTRRAQSALHRPPRSTVHSPVRPTQTFRPIENSATGSAMLAEGTAVGADRPSSARVGALVSAIQLSGLAAAPTAAVAVATIDLRLPSQPVPRVARGSAEFLQRTPSS